MRFRNCKTGEISNGHRIGKTEEGFSIYQSAEGFEPVFFHYLDEDGNPVLLPRAEETIQRCAKSWLADYKGESLDRKWSETAWSDVPSAEQNWTSWIEFHAAIAERIDTLENRIVVVDVNLGERFELTETLGVFVNSLGQSFIAKSSSDWKVGERRHAKGWLTRKPGNPDIPDFHRTLERVG